jgi:hypothetical protein
MSVDRVSRVESSEDIAKRSIIELKGEVGRQKQMEGARVELIR